MSYVIMTVKTDFNDQPEYGLIQNTGQFPYPAGPNGLLEYNDLQRATEIRDALQRSFPVERTIYVICPRQEIAVVFARNGNIRKWVWRGEYRP